jgi:hypothetical protein
MGWIANEYQFNSSLNELFFSPKYPEWLLGPPSHKVLHNNFIHVNYTSEEAVNIAAQEVNNTSVPFA